MNGDRLIRAAASAALAGVTIAGAISLGRLFSNGSFLGPVVLAAIASHVIAALCRSRRWGAGTSLAVSVAGLVLYLAWVVEPSTTAWGLPGGTFWQAVRADLAEAWRQFGELVAPVPPHRGFVLAAAAGTWLAAGVADWAAFRLGAAFESLVPGFTLFVFAAALGTPEARVPTTALFLGAVLSFLLLHGASERSSATAWFASKVGAGPQAIVRGGALLATATLLGGLVLGPALPGAGDPPVLDWRRRDSNRSSRVTVSPLVDIRSRLVTQSDVEVFSVRSNARSYWRLTSLDTFDGTVWGSRGSYRKASVRLPRGVGSDAPANAVIQEFAISGLDTPWLPAAYRADGYDGPSGVSFDPDSSSLLADANSGTGLVYQVRSALPRLAPANLRTTDDVPRDIAAHYLSLPPSFPGEVSALARRVVQGEASEYGRALALQRFFRTRFTYSLDVQPGHGDNAILAFLATRRGYCEQFAGTYAAMARAIGLPARVAVGFTAGRLAEDGLFHVTGRQAHAWPEVFFPGTGWVAFEPTPGRGMPGAESYTGVPEQQDLGTGAASAPTTVPTATPSTAPGDAGATPRPRNEIAELDSGRLGPPAPSPWPRRALIALVSLLALVAAWLSGVPAVRALRRRRRRSAATTPSERTLVAWAETAETLALVGAIRRGAETDLEYASRAAPLSGVEPAALSTLASYATAAAFAPGGVSDGVADDATGTAAQVREAVLERAGWRRRFLDAIDPRTLR